MLILKRLEVQNLELRRLHLDLIWCYKIVFQCVNVNMSDSFELNSYTRTRGHQYKLYKPSCSHNSRATFFSQRVLNVWNALPDSVDFASSNKFKQSILHIDWFCVNFLFGCMRWTPSVARLLSNASEISRNVSYRGKNPNFLVSIPNITLKESSLFSNSP